MSAVVSAPPSDPRAVVSPVPGSGLPAVRLRGVSHSSPLGKIIAAFTGLAEAAFDAGKAPEPGRWRRTVDGTALQWWSEATSDSVCTDMPDLCINLHQQESGRAGQTWCIVDVEGVPLLHRFQALKTCHSKPYIASLNLIESGDGGDTWQLVAEAHVSSVRSYRELLDVLGRTSARLLHAALRDRTSPRHPWKPGVPAPLRRGALLQAKAASGLAWLQARISGEVYGIAILDWAPAKFTESLVCAVPQWLQIPPSQGFIADPFFWPGRPGVMLCETYFHHTGLGELTVLSVEAGAIAGSDPMPIGLENSHLSYPSTWSEEGRVFCLPEMAASRRQVLYELRPGVAPEPVCVINEGVGMADPTLMRVDGLYWIAYADIDVGVYDNLCLLFAERLEGPWRLHPKNPIKIDARSCRPGGTPFWVDGQLFRPAQDCSREYGGALVISRVEVCTPEDYREQPVATLLPDLNGPFPDGLHTLSFGNGQAVIDGKRISYHPVIVFHKLFRRLKRRLVRNRSGFR
jgi:hypothetical protein